MPWPPKSGRNLNLKSFWPNLYSVCSALHICCVETWGTSCFQHLNFWNEINLHIYSFWVFQWGRLSRRDFKNLLVVYWTFLGFKSVSDKSFKTLMMSFDILKHVWRGCFTSLLCEIGPLLKCLNCLRCVLREFAHFHFNTLWETMFALCIQVEWACQSSTPASSQKSWLLAAQEYRRLLRQTL